MLVRLITLAPVTGGFALADVLHLSGPIAIVVFSIIVKDLTIGKLVKLKGL
jgi:NhaP-type Na+/H+ or K+/H+ antiporter